MTYLYELSDELTGEGYDVVVAHSGKEALEMLAAQTVDCILLDVVMPEMDGKETCRRIKANAAFARYSPNHADGARRTWTP